MNIKEYIHIYIYIYIYILNIFVLLHPSYQYHVVF